MSHSDEQSSFEEHASLLILTPAEFQTLQVIARYHYDATIMYWYSMTYDKFPLDRTVRALSKVKKLYLLRREDEPTFASVVPVIEGLLVNNEGEDEVLLELGYEEYLYLVELMQK